MAKPPVTVLTPGSHTWIFSSSCVTPVPQHLGPGQPCCGHRPHPWVQASLQLPRLVSADHPEASWIPKIVLMARKERCPWNLLFLSLAKSVGSSPSVISLWHLCTLVGDIFSGDNLNWKRGCGGDSWNFLKPELVCVLSLSDVSSESCEMRAILAFLVLNI